MPTPATNGPGRTLQRPLIWTTSPGADDLAGRRCFDHAAWRTDVERIRSADTGRATLDNPAARLFSRFQAREPVALTGVVLACAADLARIQACFVEPAVRRGCPVLVAADRDLHSLAAPEWIDPEWRYPWSLERLLFLAGLAGMPPLRPAAPTVNPRRRWWHLWPRCGDTDPPAIPTAPRLDAGQRRAVLAGDGVVQVIAPAGSGKTTVLVERARELQNRGTAAGRILCLSFNRDARLEIAARLEKAGLGGVAVSTFHGLGLRILREEGQLRRDIGGLDDAELGALELDDAYETPTPARVREIVSGFKLAAMIPPDEAVRRAPAGDGAARAAAAVYAAHEAELARRGRLDFDDLVSGAVRLLQSDGGIRARWQAAYERVLVDEYQDIEPAQALLVGLMAAPQDSLFCVGDEDQCIYAWRRADVRRIIELDQVYPGLERFSLARNYRCGRRIVRASRRLIEHNRMRFRKPLEAGAPHAGVVHAAACRTRREAARLTAWLVHDAEPGTTAVLARTSGLLDDVRNAGGWTGDDAPAELCTIHAAKGREWDRVVIHGADEGSAPHGRNLDAAGLEDERRLFYVALTRARKRLEIVCTRGRQSRFLREGGIRAVEA